MPRFDKKPNRQTCCYLTVEQIETKINIPYNASCLDLEVPGIGECSISYDAAFIRMIQSSFC